MTEPSIRREGPALLGYYESFARLRKLAEKAAKKHPRERVIDRFVRSAIDAFDAHHGRSSWGHLVCEAEPIDAETEKSLAAHWASFEEMPYELVGDAYQAVDAAVVKSHAFCQTPSFVGGFLAEHAVREASEIVGWRDMRALDPSCGAGHLLLRLALEMRSLAMREKAYYDEIDWCALAKRIIGVELNPYAARIARWQIATWVHHACARGDGTPLDYVPNVIDADVLDVGGDERRTDAVSPDAVEQLLALAREGAHAVAMNPPYIVEPDAKRREYDRKHYRSASGKYGLGVVFFERVFQVASPGAAIANITSNAFMKREYGAAHIKKVLPKVELTHIIDTSGAYIPGHGTPTVILFARNRAPLGERVFVIQGKRGEPSTPADPSRGLVWQSIVCAYRENDSTRRFLSAGKQPFAGKQPDRSETTEHRHCVTWPESVLESSRVVLICGDRRLELRGDCSVLPIHPHALEIDGALVFESKSEPDGDGSCTNGWMSDRVDVVRAAYPNDQPGLSTYEASA